MKEIIKNFTCFSSNLSIIHDKFHTSLKQPIHIVYNNPKAKLK